MPALGHDIPDAHVFTQPWPATAAEKAHGIAPARSWRPGGSEGPHLRLPHTRA
jgi:hypothetical protein